MTRLFLPALLLFAACHGHEAADVELAVAVDGSGIDIVDTNLGYTVEVIAARAAIADIVFTTAGEEQQASTLQRIGDWLLPTAHAHPGHGEGGVVTGELRGNLILDWMDDGSVLGTARLFTGRYQAANFAFRKADSQDGLEAGDPLLGHTFHLALRVSRGADTWDVEAVLDLDDGTELAGAPFDHEVTETSTETLGIQLVTVDPIEGDTLFDDIDFAPLDEDADGAMAIAPGETVHNQMRRLFSAHNFYFVEAR